MEAAQRVRLMVVEGLTVDVGVADVTCVAVVGQYGTMMEVVMVVVGLVLSVAIGGHWCVEWGRVVVVVAATT